MDIQILLNTLVTSEEKVIIVSMARQHAEQSAPEKDEGVKLDEVVPLQEPQWGITLNRERDVLSRYWEHIIYGVKKGVLKAIWPSHTRLNRKRPRSQESTMTG